MKWRWSEDGPAYASPVIGEFGGVRQVVTNSENNIVGISVADGKTLWKLPLKSPYEQNAVTPTIISDTIVYSALGNPITAIRLGSPPQKLWENREFGLYMSSPVVAAGVLCGDCRTGIKASSSASIRRQERPFSLAKADRPTMQR